MSFPNISFLSFRASGESFNEICIREYVCMVCYSFMHPPIQQCIIGHSYCFDCFKRLNSCPTCRCCHNRGRHFLMEKLHEYLVFPCKYKDQGCTAKVLGSQISTHEKNCLINWKYCPIRRFGFCTWYGPENGILEHCREVHPSLTKLGPYITYTWEHLNRAYEGQTVNFLSFVYAQTFHSKLEFDVTRTKVLWSVYNLNLDGLSLSYCFEINITLADMPNNTGHFVMVAPCTSSNSRNNTLGTKNSASMDYMTIKNFGEGNSFQCVLEIKKTSLLLELYSGLFEELLFNV